MTGAVKRIIPGAGLLALAVLLLFVTGLIGRETPLYVFSGDGEILFTSIVDKIPEPPREYTAEDYTGKTLYYTEYGEKWHLCRECQYIRDSVNVVATDYADAVSLGFTACKGCGFPDKPLD